MDFGNIQEQIKQMAAVTLAGLYLAVTLFHGIHTSFQHHHKEQDHCSEQTESDPCHLRIYHHNFAEGCQHPTHLHAPVHQCELCEALVKTVHYTDLSVWKTELQMHILRSNTRADQLVMQLHRDPISPRGPPSHA